MHGGPQIKLSQKSFFQLKRKILNQKKKKIERKRILRGTSCSLVPSPLMDGIHQNQSAITAVPLVVSNHSTHPRHLTHVNPITNFVASHPIGKKETDYEIFYMA